VLLVAWRLRFPVWSASWIGYALVFGLNQALPSQTSAWQAELILLAMLGLTLVVLAWAARRDWLAGLLAVLPLAPMRAWWLGAEPPIILLGQALTFTSIGLMVCLAVIAMLRSGRWQTAVLLLLAVELAAGMPVPAAGLTPASPSITTNLGLLLLFTAPLWLLALWRQARRQAG
jgi:hypothetical protein